MNFSLDHFKNILKNEKEDSFQLLPANFQASVLVPFIKVNGEYHLLFQKRAQHIRQGGQVSFPGGGVEQSDLTFKNTALRETVEELNLSYQDLDAFGPLKMHQTPNGTVVYPFVGEIKKDFFSLQPSKDEVDYLFVVPFSYFLEQDPEVCPKKVWINATQKEEVRNIFSYRVQGEIIWGLTAEIIVTLTEKIRDKSSR